MVIRKEYWGKFIRQTRFTAYFLGIVLFLAFLLWSYDLSGKSFWDDEILSIHHAQLLTVPSSLFSLQVGNAHPPGYFLLLRFWMLLGGGNESWVRLLSVILGLFTIPCIYFIAKRLASSTVACLASSLYVLMPLMLIYNREARMYSLFVTFSCLSLLLLLAALERDKTSDWVLFSLATFLTLITHYHGLLVLTAQSIFFLAYLPQAARRKRLVSRFAFAVGVALILFLPYVPALINAIESTGGMWRSGAKSILISRAYLVFSLLLGQTIMPWRPIAMLGAGGVLILLGSYIWQNRKNRRLVKLYASYIFVTLIVGPAVSHDMPRYYLFCVPLLCIAIASGIVYMRSHIVSVVATTLLLICWGNSAVNYFNGKDFHIMAHVDPWRDVADFIKVNMKPDDKVVAEHMQALNSYYLPNLGLRAQTIVDISQLTDINNSLRKSIWLVILNPEYTKLGIDRIQILTGDKFNYELLSTARFLRDPNHANKAVFFNKKFAEYRIEVLKLSLKK
jgi:mannosyltransferase